MAIPKTYLGHGVGLRTEHFPEVSSGEAAGQVGFLEVISENFFAAGGRPLQILETARRDVPILLHGVSLSIGGSDPLNHDYLKELRALADRFEPAWVSDHLCWGTAQGHYAHDLLPLPFTEEALANVVARVGAVQDALGRQILLENVSSYLTFGAALPQISEWEFLAEVARRADCGILLDVNNIYVSAHNHGFLARDYLAGIPVDRVAQFHLAGHQDRGDYLFDAHDGPVADPVWALYREAVARFGEVSTLIEWDANVPGFGRLVREAKRAEKHMQRALKRNAKSGAARHLRAG